MNFLNSAVNLVNKSGLSAGSTFLTFTIPGRVITAVYYAAYLLIVIAFIVLITGHFTTGAILLFISFLAMAPKLYIENMW